MSDWNSAEYDGGSLGGSQFWIHSSSSKNVNEPPPSRVKGYRPHAHSSSVIPKLQMSDVIVCELPVIRSGCRTINHRQSMPDWLTLFSSGRVCALARYIPTCT